MDRWAYLIAYVIPSLLVVGLMLEGVWLFAVPVFVFGLIPLLDMVLGRNTRNYDDATYRSRKNDFFFKLIIWVYVPIQWLLVIWATLHSVTGDLSWWAFTGLLLSMGIVSGGLGITLAHELGHRANKFEQFLAHALLLTVWYMHFFIEHNRGHHARVATKDDPASARYGESFYAFYPRSVLGGVISAWHLEARRLDKLGRSMFSLANRMYLYALMPLLLTLAFGIWLGPIAAAFFVGQAVIAFTLLELINYVEHYGLERKATGPDRFERVKPHHSWNAAQVLTNRFLFDLQRHSDHHASATRPYQTLRHFDDVPQLPTGYAGMVLLALAPPIWFGVMNPRVTNLAGAAG